MSILPKKATHMDHLCRAIRQARVEDARSVSYYADTYIQRNIRSRIGSDKDYEGIIKVISGVPLKSCKDFMDHLQECMPDSVTRFECASMIERLTHVDAKTDGLYRAEVDRLISIIPTAYERAPVLYVLVEHADDIWAGLREIIVCACGSSWILIWYHRMDGAHAT